MKGVGLLIGACMVAVSCTREQPSTKDTTTTAASIGAVGTYATVPDWYAPPPSVRTYPTASPTIHQWIQNGDTASIRAHGWDIWQSVTSPSPQNASAPVWETWYSGHEIFDPAPNPTATLRRHRLRYRFELPRQKTHVFALGRRRAPDFAERWFSFNRYTRPTAEFIYKNRLWDYRMLSDTNRAFDRLGTPVALRELSTSRGEVDPEAFVLKPVFQFVDGKNPSCIPYWSGDAPPTTSNTNNPIAKTWKQFVVIDPTGVLKGKKTAGDSIQGCRPGTQWQVVSLSSFYSVTLTQEMADSLSVFAEGSGDDIGAGNDTAVAAIKAMAKPGNLGLLVAMHVTGKEISEWTWQTFWWSPTPNDSLGFDRPASIGAPWNNYQMNTAYQMVTPSRSGPSGKPRIAFNPYLETSLCSSPQTDCANSTWYGVSTNCMSCHRMAAWKDTVTIDSTGGKHGGITGPPYVPASYVNAANPKVFGRYAKTDFLWSVAIRTRNIPKNLP